MKSMIEETSCSHTAKNLEKMSKARLQKNIYSVYRDILEDPKISKKDIDHMRKYVRMLVDTIVENILDNNTDWKQRKPIV